jgi:predicted HTH transcriptional regulator
VTDSHPSLSKSELKKFFMEVVLTRITKLQHETVNETVKISNETVKRLIECKPGVNWKRIVEMIGKSRATVMRLIAELKNEGQIEYRGCAKTGGYYVTILHTATQSHN